MKCAACLCLAILGACGDDGGAVVDAALPLDRPALQNQGLVWILQATDLQNGDITSIIGMFGPDLLPRMDIRDDGPCRLSRVSTGGAARENAGQIRITATGGSNSVVTLPAGTQYVDGLESFRYVGGETLLIESMGATVPAFSHSITFPQKPSVTTSPSVLDKGQDFTVTWTPTTTDVMVQLTQSVGPGDHLIRCHFPGASGTGTIPASVFAELATGQQASVLVSGHYEGVADAGSYAIDVETVWYALTTSFIVR